ncbi:MAG: hypothetical protein ACR2P1_04645 [Pseudomonadales bacterium]
MQALVVQLVIWLVAIGGVLAAAKLLLKRDWFSGWLRGSLGLLLLAAALVSVAMALDFRTYQTWQEAQTIANISFEQLDEQRFIARLSRPGGIEQVFELYGDQWQVDVRILNWTRALRNLRVKPMYKFDRLSGRYLFLEQELVSQPRSYALTQNLAGIDSERLVRAVQDTLPWINPGQGSAAFMPMAADAEYALQLTAVGLTARAQNEAAQQALAMW